MSLISLIQARMSSGRLPGKVLLPLGDQTVLDHVVQRAAQFSEQVVVCTSTDPDDDAIEEHCLRKRTLCVRGPLDDVFGRFRLALNHPKVTQSDYFARITADSPLLSVELAHFLIGHMGPQWDYLRLDHDSIPLGTGLEIVRTKTFLEVDVECLDAAEREHVTLHFYEKAGRYRATEIQAPTTLRAPHLRLTLDYPQDYELMTRIFGHTSNPTLRRIIELLRDRSDWATLNASCGQRQARSEE